MKPLLPAIFPASRILRAAALMLVLLAQATALRAFPPAPPHTFTGMVRNEWGDPIDVSSAQVFLETTNGVSLSVNIRAAAGAGVNYRLEVPMDTRATIDLSDPNAMATGFPFRLRVRIGTKTYLPMEMAVGFQGIGKPAVTQRLDLTLGVDSDGDGLPDAWELANGLNPNDPTDADKDSDGDGLSNRTEYLIGTYAFDPAVGFSLTPVGVSADGDALLEFFAVRGRTYTVMSSADLKTWSASSLKPVAADGTVGGLQPGITATDYRNLRVAVPFGSGGPTNLFFKAMVQ